MTGTDDATLRLERLIASPPELLFSLFIEPAQLVKWWAPDGYEAAVDALDVRPGGTWRMVLSRADGARLVNSGVYRVIEPPRRLSFSFAWEDSARARGHETDVTVSFETVPGGTRLVIEQQRFESKAARDGHHRGWSACLDRIKTIVDE